MVTTSPTLTVEIDTPRNQNLFFVPLGETLRGRFDWNRIANRNGVSLRWEDGPGYLPGQRVQLDLDKGEAKILEPLEGAEFRGYRRRIQKMGMDVPDTKHVGKVDLNTWLFWLKNACDAGYATLVEGEFPDTINPDKVQGKSPPYVSDVDRLAAAVEKQTETISTLLRDLARGRG